MFSRIRYYLQTSFFLLLFSLIVPVWANYLFAQTDPESQAKQLFEEGRYTEALPVFRDLVRLYPTDESLNYHLGVCLSETEEFSTETQHALLAAGEKQTKRLYYLGQYFQAQSDWENAEKYYREYISSAKSKDVKNTRANELLLLSKDHVNPFKTAQTNEPLQTETAEPIIPAAADTFVVTPPVLAEIPDELKDENINFQVNSQVRYLKITQFKNESSKQAFTNGWKTEQKLQARLAEITKLRKEYENATDSLKETLVGKILKLEQETYQLNLAARNAYLKANENEAKYWDEASGEKIKQIQEQNAQIEESIQADKESVLKLKTETSTQPLVIVSDTTEVQKTDEILPAADNIIYKIQIGAYKRTPPDWVQRLYKKLAVLRRIDQYTDEKGVTVYTVGELKSYSDAVQMQNQVKLEGVKDAIIAAYKNNERISVNEARKLSD